MESKLGPKSPVADLNECKEQYIILWTLQGPLYGKLLDCDSQYITLTERLRWIYGPKGRVYIADANAEAVNTNIVVGFRSITQDEFQNFIDYSEPITQYLDKLVHVTKNQENYYGTLFAIYEHELLLKPSLVSMLKKPSKNRTSEAEWVARWENEVPTLVTRPASIMKINKSDLDMLLNR